jgi:hypothetical protein
MTASSHTMPEGVLLTTEHIRRWEEGLRRIDDEIDRLSSNRKLLEQKLAAAALFYDVSEDRDDGGHHRTSEETFESAGDLPPTVNGATPETQKDTRRRNGDEPTWAEIVIEAVKSADMGVTYAEMRSFAAASALGAKLEISDKGYYNAISRLAKGGDIVRKHGRLFTQEAFRRFIKAVEEGQASTTIPQPIAHSPMGEAILTIVKQQPGKLNGKGVIGELRRDPEFDAALTPHETGAYNVIARLVRREQIVRRDDGLLIPGRNFPQDRGTYMPLRNGALDGHAASAPSAGEVAPSPNNDPPSFRLVG